MIEVQGVSKQFAGEAVVRDITLSVHKGTILGLLGSNGAGKTTLLKTMAGIMRPDGGQVVLEGEEVYENPRAKSRLVFLADAPYYFPQSSVRQMAAFYRSVYPGWSERKFAELAPLFKLDPDRKLARMSKGMRRQAAVWLGLSCMPEVLILDEPIDGLDPVMRRQVKNLLFQEVAEREMTVVVSSHNLREIEDLCDHIALMHEGRLLLNKELDDLRTATHKVQAALRDERHERALEAKLDIVHRERRGSVSLYIVRGEEERIKEVFRVYDPYVLDLLPLTLEEIFVYEMEGAGYDLQTILVE